jgi:hypothetical protein
MSKMRQAVASALLTGAAVLIGFTSPALSTVAAGTGDIPQAHGQVTAAAEVQQQAKANDMVWG